ncbi:type IV toxin-antitoxin system AbiEi family antitoxin domain-containing protein [Eggerthella timonensis]|uniref:type IV toxin-antitoxin system AbiEi family antitoxin domain-containing protein n=1 Tax=Eggerthella timonensis TaxID=1871008 RepID=UPI000C7954FD|nr:type IV toxin-antitoxin system AbiEi family antitoxin domain-containing protein [Eggerthella timonensis]
MAKIDEIYDAVDDFGLITSAEARDLGVSNAELTQLARRGKLQRVARGVYRMPVWPYQEASPYAIAVKSAGPDAYLYGESVVALLGLAPIDPGRMWVASPSRVRRRLGEGVQVIGRRPREQVVRYEGVPSQPAADAVKEAAGTMGPFRARQAAEEAARLGYLTQGEKERLVEELEA